MPVSRSTTSAERGRRVRVDLTLPPPLVDALRAYTQEWRFPLSGVVEVACAEFLADRAKRADASPLQVRLRQRRGPRSAFERALERDVTSALRERGGRGLKP